MSIDLEVQPMPVTTARRTGTVVAVLAGALGLAVGLLIGFVRPASAPAIPTVTVEVGASEYPAPLVAAWWDRDGHRGTLDPWSGKPVRLQAVRVAIAVAYMDDPVQCTITVNGAVVDTQSANTSGEVALCEWSA